MLRIFLSFWLAITPTFAFAGSISLLGAGVQTSGGAAYAGPGDVVSGASMWFGLRGYNAAYAGASINVCLPSDTSCADFSISSGNLVVAAISGTSCNNSTVICTIKTIYDQSGANHCSAAPCNFTQATIASRATLIVAGAANGCPSTSKPCAGFGGSAFYVISTATSFGATPYTISAVAIRTGNTGAGLYGSVLIANTGNDGLQFGNNANEVDLFAGADHVATATDSVWHAIQAISNTTSSSLNIDGTQTTFTTTARTLNNNVEMGADTGGTADKWIGKFEEAGIWPALAFTSGNISSVNSQQHSYWGF